MSVRLTALYLQSAAASGSPRSYTFIGAWTANSIVGLGCDAMTFVD